MAMDSKVIGKAVVMTNGADLLGGDGAVVVPGGDGAEVAVVETLMANFCPWTVHSKYK